MARYCTKTVVAHLKTPTGHRLSKPREDSWRPIGSNLVLRGRSGRVFLKDLRRTKGAGTRCVPAPLGLPVESVPVEISG
jgi:hypothetical protein